MTKSIFSLSLFLLFVVSLTQCGKESKEASSSSSALKTEIEGLLMENKFSEALNQLSLAQQGNPEVVELTQKARTAYQEWFEGQLETLRASDLSEISNKQALAETHLNYGIFLEYQAEHLQMRPRMVSALQHFRRVLELDPSNVKAQAEIAQIEGIYKQMGRPVPEGVAK